MRWMASSLQIQPRVCGDYPPHFFNCSPSCDTPPRVRGLRRAGRTGLHAGRYNPACAGTTFQCFSCHSCQAIQPRVCGDYGGDNDNIVATSDTTPRVRGLQVAKGFHEFRFRYNPACAGTTEEDVLHSHLGAIQPRVCGDYTSSVISL